MAPFPCFFKKGVLHFHFAPSLVIYAAGPVPVSTLNYAQVSNFLFPLFSLISLHLNEGMEATLKILLSPTVYI